MPGWWRLKNTWLSKKKLKRGGGGRGGPSAEGGWVNEGETELKGGLGWEKKKGIKRDTKKTQRRKRG